MGFLTERKKESHQKYDAKQVPGKGPATARADGAPPWGQGLGPNLSCSRNYLRANSRDSVVWEQKAGATSNRANCFKTAGYSRAWSPGASARSWVPVPGSGPAELCSQAQGAQPPHERALGSVQTQEFSRVQEELHTDSYTLTSSLERSFCLQNHFQHGAAADAPRSVHM